jgi:DNA-binding transcriptional MerR regulator
MQIGEVAERTGLTQRTIRFYEEKGILDAPARMEGGFRLYTEADVERIKGISQLRQLLCFSLEQMKELVEAENLLNRPQPTAADPTAELKRLHAAIEVLSAQAEHIEEKYQQLKQLRSKWRQRLTAYQERYGALRSSKAPQAARKV